MNIQLETHEVSLPHESDKGLRAQLQKTFARFGSSIAYLTVTLKDINGPRGGRDKVCQVHARFHAGGEVFVKDRREHLREAIHHCIARTKATVAKRLQQQSQQGRGRSLKRALVVS